MNELKAIIEAFNQAENNNQKTALATVVNVQGSAYRQIGAKLLIFEDGKRVGSISGGCLENDVCEWAKKLIQTGQSQVITYDTTTPEDIILGLGLGCNGVIEVLIEPLATDQYKQQIQFIDKCLTTRKIGAIATILQVEEPSKILFSSQIFIDQKEIISNPIEDSRLSENILKDAKTALNHQQSQVKTYLWNQTEFKVLIDIIKPALSLASADLMAEVLIGKTIAESLLIIQDFLNLIQGNHQFNEPFKKLNIFTTIVQYPIRIKCAALSWSTLESALKSHPKYPIL